MYLSAEPLLQNPNFVKSMAMRGLSTPTYAYALNNPLRFVDRNGLNLGDPFPDAERAVQDVSDYLRKTGADLNVEWAGFVYVNAGKYYATTPGNLCGTKWANGARHYSIPWTGGLLSTDGYIIATYHSHPDQTGVEPNLRDRRDYPSGYDLSAQVPIPAWLIRPNGTVIGPWPTAPVRPFSPP